MIANVFAQPDQFQYQYQPYTALSYVFFLEATMMLNNVNIQEALSKRTDSDWECNTNTNLTQSQILNENFGLCITRNSLLI